MFRQVENELNLPPLHSVAQPQALSHSSSGAPDLAAMAATLSGTPLGPEPGVTTRLDEYNAARQDRGLVAEYSPAGRFDLLKFFSGEGARFPVAHKTAKRVLPDLMSEGVSESRLKPRVYF